MAAATPEPIDRAVIPTSISTHTERVEYIFVVPSNPISTDNKKSTENINPDLTPAPNVRACDHLITVVTRNPIAIEESIVGMISVCDAGLNTRLNCSGGSAP